MHSSETPGRPPRPSTNRAGPGTYKAFGFVAYEAVWGLKKPVAKIVEGG